MHITGFRKGIYMVYSPPLLMDTEMFCGLGSRIPRKHADDEGTIYNASVNADYPTPEVIYLHETNLYYTV